MDRPIVPPLSAEVSWHLYKTEPAHRQLIVYNHYAANKDPYRYSDTAPIERETSGLFAGAGLHR